MMKIKIRKKKQVTGAIVVLLDEENRTLILLRPKEAHWAPHKWGYPGGKIEEGEDPETAAIRETKEETQLTVWNLEPLPALHSPEVASYYSLDFEGEVEIDFEHEDWKWVSRDEIEEYPLAPGTLDMFEWVLKNG